MKNQEFGARLRELRKKAGMSQRELARKIGIDFSYLSKIESGVMPPPSEKVILRIGEFLNIDRDELLTLAGKIPADIAQILQNREARQLLRSDRTQKKIRAANIKKEGNSIMKNLFRYKYLSRAAIAIVLVCAVAASLWYATPTKALDVSYPTLPSGTLGSTHSFKVKIDIPNPEIVPVNSIDMEIYNVSDTTKKMTCTALPLTNGGSGSYSTSGGTVSVTASATNWGELTGSGYADWKGTGYSWGGGVTGYGYGAVGTASMQYTGTWTSPSGWPSGGYQIKVTINTDTTTSPAGRQTFDEYSDHFTLSAPVFGGGVPSGAPPAPVSTDGKTYVAKVVTNEGRFTQDVTADSGDGKVSLNIPKDTIGKTESGQRIPSIDITPMTDPPAPPTGANIIGLTYDLRPDGATFDPAITLTFEYDESLIPAGTAEADLVVAFYNAATGEWVELPCTVNTETNTITATVSHFTAFTILAKVPAPPPTPPTPPAPAPAAFTISNLTVSPMEVKTGEAITITASVANTGGSEGSYTVTLKVNGLQESQKSVTISAGSSQTVTFSVTKTTAGSYSVEVNGLSSRFTVTAPVPPPPPTTPTMPTTPTTPTLPSGGGIAWWVWLIVGIVAVAVIGVIVWLVSKRRTA